MALRQNVSIDGEFIMEVLMIRKDLLRQYLDDSLIQLIVATTEETIHNLDFSYQFNCNQCSFKTDKMSSLKMHNLTHRINQTPKKQVSSSEEGEAIVIVTNTAANYGASIDGEYETDAIADRQYEDFVPNAPEKGHNIESIDNDYIADLAESDFKIGLLPDFCGSWTDYNADSAKSDLIDEIAGSVYNIDEAESDINADLETNDDTDPEYNADESDVNADLETNDDTDPEYKADESETDSDGDETDDGSDPDFSADESNTDSSDDEEDMKYNMQCEACSKKIYVKNPASAKGYKCPDCCGDVEMVTSLMKKTNISGEKVNATKVHQCDICLQYFSSDASVNVHKPYCLKDSDSPNISTDAASNANPHQCDMCHKSYKRPGDLKRHMKVHQNDAGIAELDSTAVPLSLEELNTCSTPSRKSDRRSIITKKVLVVTEDDDSYVDTYQCEYCNKSYASKGYLMRHIKSMHTLSQSMIVM